MASARDTLFAIGACSSAEEHRTSNPTVGGSNPPRRIPRTSPLRLRRVARTSLSDRAFESGRNGHGPSRARKGGPHPYGLLLTNSYKSAPWRERHLPRLHRHRRDRCDHAPLLVESPHLQAGRLRAASDRSLAAAAPRDQPAHSLAV